MKIPVMKHLKYLILAVMFLINGYTNAQKIMIGSEETNRKLTWDDFRGTPQYNSPHYAMTHWQMSYSMDGIRTYGDSIHVGKLQVILEMETNKSWVKKDKGTDELLKHEQGHFDIGVLCMREFISLFNKATFRKNDFDSQMKKIFYDTMNKYHDLGEQYDKETKHSNNKEAQQYWNEFFAKYI